MLVAACPNREQLSAFVRGDVPEDGASAIFSHLDTCESCQATVDALTAAEDSLISSLRKPHVAVEERSQPGMQQMLDQAAMLTREESETKISRPRNVPEDIQQFATHLRKSGLLCDDEIDAALAGSNADTLSGFARELVKAEKLTKYQARMLAQGKSKFLVLGNYQIQDAIGKGGMGMVFLAKHRVMNRVVALKVLPPSSTRSEQKVKRFHREVETAARLQHKNIVAAFDADESSGLHFMVMEYVAGRDLSRVVRSRGSLNVRQTIDCIVQAARALAYAHEQGVIHRDIKPANLLLDTDGVVKVLDMGLARFNIHEEGDDGLTKSGTVMGTVDFMSPEQALNSKYANEQSDIYSLGYTLYFLLTGHAAYDGETVVEKLVAHREQPAPSLRGERPDTPPALEAVYAKMVAKKPEHRFASMNEVVQALQAIDTNTTGDATGEDSSIHSVSVAAPLAIPADANDDALSLLDEFASVEGTAQMSVSQSPSGFGSTIGAHAETPTFIEPRVRAPRRAKAGLITAIISGAVLTAFFGAVILGSLVYSIIYSNDSMNEGTGNGVAPKNGVRVALVVTDGFYDHYYNRVKSELENSGFETVAVSDANSKTVTGKLGTQVNPVKSYTQVTPNEFESVVVIGNARFHEYLKKWDHKTQLVELSRRMAEADKSIVGVGNGQLIFDHAKLLDNVPCTACDKSWVPSAKFVYDTPFVEAGNIATTTDEKATPKVVAFIKQRSGVKQ